MPGRSPYVELHLHSCWSLREGASKPEELLATASALGYDRLALTDHDALYGSMEFAQQAHEIGIQPITGAEITLTDGSHLTVLAETVEGYRNLCRILSLAHAAGRDTPHTDRETFFAHSAGLIVLSGCREGEIARLVDSGAMRAAEVVAREYSERFGPDQFFLEIQHHDIHGDSARVTSLLDLASRTGIPTVATNNVHYHVRARHRLNDVLVAIRHRRTLDSSHELRRANSEFYLKSPEEMATRFSSCPEAITATREIAERCSFDLATDLPYALPGYATPHGESMDEYLRSICEEAFQRKYGAQVSHDQRVDGRRRLERELLLIEKHGLAGFFLVYWELLKLAGDIAHELHKRPLDLRPDQRPVARGRGSSVASIVCYLIGLSHIDPVKTNLYLDRFLNDELHSLPDIDLDFPRDIRDEILKRIPTHFGPEHAALVAAFPTYRFRNAVRDVGKVLGLPEPLLTRLTKLGGNAYAGPEAIAAGMRHIPELRSLIDAPAWRNLVEIATELEGFPRHISQHSGGIVISAEPLSSIVPVEPARMEGRLLCQWDKDSVDDARMVKIDLLALGMLSAIDECLAIIEETHGTRPDLGRIDYQDPEIYASIQAGDTIGLFQIESRAQIQSLPRTQPQTLDDLATQVAIIRPGPIMAGAFAPYMERKARRARGDDIIPVDYGHPQLEEPLQDILGPTLGHVLYQDQVLQIGVAIAGFTPGKADELRRAMSRKRSDEAMGALSGDFAERARAKGFCDEAILAAWTRMRSFASFGFPKSHAVAFALLAYESAWLRRYYPAAYYSALINSQPMGFYSIETLCNDARRHGLDVALPEVNASREGAWPSNDGIQLGLQQVQRIGSDWRTRKSSVATRIATSREVDGPYTSLYDLITRTRLAKDEAEALIRADALRSLGLSRRELLWQLGLLVPQTALQPTLPLPTEQDMVDLPELSDWDQVSWDFETLGASSTHPMALVRPLLHEGIVASLHVGGPMNPNRLHQGMTVRVAGMVVCRQKPITASGLMFLSLEDEWGLVSVVIYKEIQERYRELVYATPFIVVQGIVDNERSGFPHIIASRLFPCPLPSNRVFTPKSHDFG